VNRYLDPPKRFSIFPLMRYLAVALSVAFLLSVPANAERAPNATIEPTELVEFSFQPSRIKELIVFALALTKLDLDYAFGSDDPARGGMDCSGTIYHLLRTQGLKEVPRDSASQYEWTRAALGFHDVASKSGDSEEFADLRPGDLMFWTGTYETHRAGVAVSHVMLYLGTEKKTGKRVMFGASDGRSYNGVQRFGVSVFDFKMPRLEDTKTDFLGYGRIPGYASGTIAATADLIKPAAKDEEEATPKTKTGEKSETTKMKSAEPESETPKTKSKTGKAKSKTQTTAKAETEETETEVQKPESQANKSKAGTQKAKAETDEPQRAAQKSKLQSQKPKSEVSNAKTETGKNSSEASEPEPKTQNPKAGFQKPKDTTAEPPTDVQKSKPQTPKPKSRTKSKTSKRVSDE
jgi:hypothetical protein